MCLLHVSQAQFPPEQSKLEGIFYSDFIFVLGQLNTYDVGFEDLWSWSAQLGALASQCCSSSWKHQEEKVSSPTTRNFQPVVLFALYRLIKTPNG